jgi:hypothetical protein
MRSHFPLWLVCATIFLSVLLVSASAAEKEPMGLDVYVLGQHAYVAGGASGLYVVDIRRSANPKQVASMDTPGDARDVDVFGDYAFVADFSNGIHAIDISNPARPRVAGTLDTPGEALGCYPLYDLLVVADGSRGLQLINKHNPRSLRIVASYDTPGETRSVHGSASRVYVTGLDFGLGVFDVIDRSRLNTNGHFLVLPDR